MGQLRQRHGKRRRFKQQLSKQPLKCGKQYFSTGGAYDKKKLKSNFNENKFCNSQRLTRLPLVKFRADCGGLALESTVWHLISRHFIAALVVNVSLPQSLNQHISFHLTRSPWTSSNLPVSASLMAITHIHALSKHAHPKVSMCVSVCVEGPLH